MTKNSVADALREMIVNKKPRSETRRIFDLICEIETALESGFSREEVLKTLNAQGFSLTLNSFKNALHAARKKRGKLATTTNTTSAIQNPLTIEKPVATQASTPVPEPAAQQTEKKATWMSPAEIRRRREERMARLDRDFESYGQ